MPIPKPRTNEDKDDYIDRCMRSTIMRGEFPERKQRTDVCNSTWGNKSFTSGINKVEIFAVGKWNGHVFTVKDLEGIVDAFDTLSDVHEVPLKFGHNDKQPMTDGKMALGWVDSIWVEGKKLFGKFVDMPEVVLSAIEKRRYKKVSVELDVNVSYKGHKFKNVLSGVALLGADLPAVNVLKDLTAYMSSNRSLSFGRRLLFTAINSERNMGATVEQLEAQLAAEKLEREKDKLKFKADADASNRELDTLKKDNEDRKTNELKEKIECKRKILKVKLEDAVKDERITPAQRDSYTKVLKVDTDEVTEVSIEDLDALIGKPKEVKKFSKEDNKAKNKGGTDDAKPVGEQILTLTRKFMAEHGEKDFSEAMMTVMQANEELAEEYKGSNGTKGVN